MTQRAWVNCSRSLKSGGVVFWSRIWVHNHCITPTLWGTLTGDLTYINFHQFSWHLYKVNTISPFSQWGTWCWERLTVTQLTGGRGRMQTQVKLLIPRGCCQGQHKWLGPSKSQPWNLNSYPSVKKNPWLLRGNCLVVFFKWGWKIPNSSRRIWKVSLAEIERIWGKNHGNQP